MRSLIIASVLVTASFARADVCRTSDQCRGGDAKCIEGQCRVVAEVLEERARPSSTRAFIGVLALGGVALAAAERGRAVVSPLSELFALRFGLLFPRAELALEISPFAYWYFQNTPGPTFEASVSVAYRAKVSRAISWPLRVGFGVFTGNTGDDLYMQWTLDALGVSVRAGNWLVGVYAPSIRYAYLLGHGVQLLSWDAGVSIDRVF